MKSLLKAFAIAALAIGLTACDRAPANVKVIQTTDCGKSWKEIRTGDRIPTTTGNVCGYNVSMPDYPMQGDAEFLTQFKNNVLVRVQIGYDYQIDEPLRYIEYAKFLGKMESSTGGGQADSRYESAENVVIDLRLRELVTSKTSAHDIVSFNPSEFEDEIFKDAGKVLLERGIRINSMTFVVLPEEQTRMAIDAATAMAIYESKGLGEFGKQIAIARASASRITQTNTVPAVKN